eukprot:CAMPEP_0179043776 /NCGR_PEP_ID=MMETSP0796-20121207/17336_1 /TAXON_ID=73915 /ORGANISM="Pyrodinium bahamense, Strain pbaha01" /LENGTH=118 /DNA_ID=CAMNT_0020740161 /DNA_START=77 /DNA_END=433 /DNA_ORIENTATION=+
MASPWECVCEFIRSQSANLQNVLQSLGNQQTFSDIDTSDTLTLNSGISPLHLFMFLLLAVWGFLYVQGRRTTEAQKLPPGPPPPSGAGDGGGSSSSSGGGGAGSSSSSNGGQGAGELF